MMRETGPNDASRIVWALGEFYIVILINYYLLLYYLYTVPIQSICQLHVTPIFFDPGFKNFLIF